MMPLLMALLLVGCDPHEDALPIGSDKPCTVTLRLSFSTPLPLFREVDYNSRMAEPLDSAYDVRYVVKAYPAGATETTAPSFQQVFTKPIDNEWDCELPVALTGGDYDIYVWADFVKHGTTADNFHDTSNFANIALTEPYVGNSDYRDAFRGYAMAVSLAPNSSCSVDVEMVRPLAQYLFIATDIQDFVERERQRIEAKGMSVEFFNQTYAKTKGVGDAEPEDASALNVPYIVDGLDLSQYEVEFVYTGYLPNAFDMFIDKPVNSTLGVTFMSTITKSDESTAAIMGCDYVMVNGHESEVQVRMKVYAPDDECVSQTGDIAVPITRSKQTIVRGDFLTQQQTEGIGVDPTFEGTYIIYY
jgi:hypothetical protein